MAYMHRDFNIGFLFLIVLMGAFLITSTIFFHLKFDDLTSQYSDKAYEAEVLSQKLSIESERSAVMEQQLGKMGQREQVLAEVLKSERDSKKKQLQQAIELAPVTKPIVEQPKKVEVSKELKRQYHIGDNSKKFSGGIEGA